MAGIPGTAFLLGRPPDGRRGRWSCSSGGGLPQWLRANAAIPPCPPAPSAPPAQPAPPAPLAPPAPPAPTVFMNGAPVLTTCPPLLPCQILLMQRSVMRWPRSSPGVGGGDGDDDCPYWGRPDNSWWDQSAVGEDDDVEYWSRDGLPEHLPIPTYPPRSKKRPHPSTKKQDAHPLSPRFRKNTRKHHAYTVGEKVKWVLRLEAVDNVSEVARESGIYRECLTEWKRQYDDLNKVAACRKRLHGHGRASWYPDMEAELYSRS
ncbi:unnamed protein product [Closterium sp. NIES-54]